MGMGVLLKVLWALSVAHHAVRSEGEICDGGFKSEYD